MRFEEFLMLKIEYNKLSFLFTFGILMLIFSILTFSIYSNILNSPFLFDDWIRISKNPNVRLNAFSLEGIWKSAFNKQSSGNRPVSNITFALNYYFNQYDTTGYHIINLILHIVNGILLFSFVRLLLISYFTHGDRNTTQQENSFLQTRIPFFTAIIWITHPLHINSVTYIVQRMNSMATMFYLLSLIFYIKGRLAQKLTKCKRQKSVSLPFLFFSSALLAWVVSLGCKQNSAILPFIVLLFEFYFFQDLKQEWFINFRKYALVVCCFCFLIGLAYADFNPFLYFTKIRDFASHQFTYYERLLTEIRVLIYYLSLIFYPHPSRLTVDYDFPISHSPIDPLTTILAFIAIITLIGFSFRSAKIKRIVAFSILWFFGNLLIESSFIPLSIINEYRTYLPSMLVILFFVMIANHYVKSKQWATVLFMCISVFFSLWTYQRNIVWHDEVSILQDSVKKSPHKSRPHANLAAYLLSKDIEKAEMHAIKAVKSKLSDVNAYLILGQVFRQKGNFQKATDVYLKGILYKPDAPQFYNELGITCLLIDQNKNQKQCHQFFHKALSVDPSSEIAHSALGEYFLNMDQPDKAIFHLQNVIQINPFNARAFFILGGIFETRNDYALAEKYYKKALQLDYDPVRTHNSLGVILLKNNRLKEAEKLFSKIIKTNPNFPESYNNLGLLMEKKGDKQKAIEYYRQAIKIQPDFITAYNNLGVVLYSNNKREEAINCFKKAIEIDSNRKDIIYNLEKVLSSK
jgi:protein O-mannosyl-transferase